VYPFFQASRSAPIFKIGVLPPIGFATYPALKGCLLAMKEMVQDKKMFLSDVMRKI